MCLGIVGRIEELKKDNMAVVEIMGVQREISVILVPEIKVGQYVMIHAGFAINPIDEKEAKETEELLQKVFGDDIVF
ncbi:hydrogenase assembly protein HypC [candidate division WOR-3 bacterium RBG_13_43_14]|uniref:Hydrogenase assembly protein HypC n=1 Tax=candidate division WOR-3 bacterium RBG_13_43_14 TaxID=1802590 RepID=A0A1F4UEU1_UNCW3|nr:MAG: hydrogenase assembly protein HypC [candidate division WOR-3 bacterium RBG_13_43_14]